MPMLNDRFGKIMLIVIAALLAANLFRTGKPQLVLPLESSAQAQNVISSNPGSSTPKKLLVRNIQGFSVADVKEVVSLGDGKTFVVSNPNGFMVYTVEPQM